MNKDTAELLLLAALFAAASVILAFMAETNVAGAAGSGSAVWLCFAGFVHRQQSLARHAIPLLPATLRQSIRPAHRNALVVTLARLDQRIERAQAVLAAIKNGDTKLRAEVSLADLENARYEVEGELKPSE
jgi:hypothetical protein